MFNIAKYRNQFFILPGVLSALAILAILVWGLKPGIDLAGGSLLEVSFPNGRPAVEEVRATIEPLGYGQALIQPTQENDYIIRQKELTPEEKGALITTLGALGEVREEQFNSVGPTIGAELLRKAWWAIALVALSIIAFIAFAFRGVSEPLSSWKYGVIVIVTLLHDIVIPAGMFAYFGQTRGAEVDALFIVALLTILGISVNDTIVVFDRIRENLKRNKLANRFEAFGDVVSKSVNQTLTRSINTSLTVIVMLVALYVLGPASTRDFALTLTVGMVVGTYSSIFLAAPLLLFWEQWQKKKVVAK